MRRQPRRLHRGCVCCVYGNGNSRCRPPQECSGTVVSSTTTPAPTTTTTMTAEPTCLNQGLGVCLPGQNACLANRSCAKSCTFGGCPAGCGCVPAAEGGGYCRAAEVCLPTDQVCTGTADCPRGMLCQATVCSAGGPTERRCKLLCPTA